MIIDDNYVNVLPLLLNRWGELLQQANDKHLTEFIFIFEGEWYISAWHRSHGFSLPRNITVLGADNDNRKDEV